MRLSLCSGADRFSGYVHLDARNLGAEIIAVIPPLPAEVTTERWEEIVWIHGPSSLFSWEAQQVFRECHQVLIDGGRLITECPDALKCCAVNDLHGLFGDQTRGPLLANRYGWHAESLSKALLAAGFSEVHLKPAQFHIPARDFRMEAIK